MSHPGMIKALPLKPVRVCARVCVGCRCVVVLLLLRWCVVVLLLLRWCVVV